MLLHTSTLEVAGSSQLAAIRFSSAVCVERIRIFPHNAQLFPDQPDLVSHTDKGCSLILTVFFNAQPLPTPADPKPKPSNALVPTTIAYAGGIRDFPLDMTHFSTRLMIIKGEFKRLTLAIYGQLASDAPKQLSALPSYSPSELESPPAISLLPIMDPASSVEPTLLAMRTLATIPNVPSLPHLIRLMFCLKPDDWDVPGFPFVYADLEGCLGVDDIGLNWLRKAANAMGTPVNEDIPLETVRDFGTRLKESLGPKSTNQSVQIARLLSNIASQPPFVAEIILDICPLDLVFDSKFDDIELALDILDFLWDAAGNPCTARHLNTPQMREIIDALYANPAGNDELRQLTLRLLNRLDGWGKFEASWEDAEDFDHTVGMWVKDIASEEASFGSFLLALLTHEHLVAKLQGVSVMNASSTGFPVIWDLQPGQQLSLSDRAQFFRAFIGISAVFAVLSWADSEGLPCVERIVGFLRLWQENPGYCEIVNHILLLPQMVFRVECMIDADPPSQCTLLAEQLLMRLVSDPTSLLRDRLSKFVVSWDQPLLSVPEDERLPMFKGALVAREGVSRAVRTVLEWDNSLHQCIDEGETYVLHVALAVIEAELSRDGEERVMSALWKQNAHGLVSILVEAVSRFSDEIKTHFGLAPPPSLPVTLVSRLFNISAILLRLISRLVLTHPPLPLTTNTLASAIATLFVSSNVALKRRPSTTTVLRAAALAHETCIKALRTLTCVAEPSSIGHTAGERVLRALLQGGTCPSGEDPIQRVTQTLHLLEIIFFQQGLDSQTDSSRRFWSRKISLLLQEVYQFVQALEPYPRASFVKLLVDIDQSELGIGEWILSQELQGMVSAQKTLLLDSSLDPTRTMFINYRLAFSFEFLLNLIQEPLASKWAISCLLEPSAGVRRRLDACLSNVAQSSLWIPAAFNLGQILAENVSETDSQLRTTLALVLFRGSRSKPDEYLYSAYQLLEKLVGLDPQVLEQLCIQLGLTLKAIAGDGQEPTHWEDPIATCGTVRSLLEWAAISRGDSVDATIPTFSETTFDQLCDVFSRITSTESLVTMRYQLRFPQDESMITTSDDIALDEKPALSLQDIQNLLGPQEQPAPSTPPRNPVLYQQDVLDFAMISPPTLLRSPQVATLTKTYNRNEFRDLRSVPSARQNTSRPPSMHVDDFELGASPTRSPAILPNAHAHSPQLQAAFGTTPQITFQSYNPLSSSPPY